jgi:hypothetical protein
VIDWNRNCRSLIACLAWSSAARHVGSRDRHIDWSAAARHSTPQPDPLHRFELALPAAAEVSNILHHLAN